MIRFDVNETTLLLNPRLPESEVASANSLIESQLAPGGLVWLLTSGSSGDRKLVGLHRDALMASAESVNRHLCASSNDRWLLALPTFHGGGLAIYARAHASGASVITPFLESKWSATVYLLALEKEACTLSSLVPTQLFDLVATGCRCPESLRAIIVGGGVLSQELYENARGLGYPVLPSYGLTECASQVATAPLPITDEKEAFSPLPLPHVNVRISESGRIQIKSDALFSGYLFEKQGRPVFEDPKVEGWFESEDRGVLDGGRLTVLGRDAKFVKVGGENVDLNRLETIFGRVREEVTQSDAVLTTKPDERLGHLIVMVIEKGAGASEASELKSRFNDAVMPFERVRAVAWVDRIPRSDLGKVLPIDLNGVEIK